MKKKLLFAALTALLASLLYFAAVPAFAQEGFAAGFTWTGDRVDGISAYGNAQVSVLAAADESIPEGNTGNVMRVSSSISQFGVTFTPQEEVPRQRILSLSFRVYVEPTGADNASYPEIRVGLTAGTNWVHREYVAKDGHIGQWVDIQFTSSELDTLCPQGTLSSFEIGYRGNAASVFYIDDLALSLSEADDTPPVLNVPRTSYTAEAGSIPVPDVTATDDSGYVQVEYIWSEGALDGYGRLTEGEHILTVVASDLYGNTARTVIAYTVTAAQDGEEIYSVLFRWHGGEELVEYTAATASLVEPPVIPVREHYSAEWNFEPAFEVGQTVDAVYTPVAYTVTFAADGKTVGEETYTVEDKHVEEPALPQKEGYNGAWEAYELNCADVTVNAVYTAIPYSVTFVAEGEVVAVVYYTAETEEIEEPAVPVKDGEEGVWETYVLGAEDIVVRAVYGEAGGCGGSVAAACALPAALLLVAAAVLLRRRTNK